MSLRVLASDAVAGTNDPCVDLWHVHVPHHLCALEAHWQRLDASERQRAASFHREADRQRYVISQGSIRRVLGQRLGVDSAHLTFERGEFGKPFLATHPALHFNTSHSGDWVVHGVSASTPLGVDVEAIAPGPIDLQDFRHVLTAHEFERLSALPATRLNPAFISTWVRKEAYVKATGHGLSKPLGDICIELLEGGHFGLIHDHHPQPPGTGWNWQMLDLGPDHVGCLAYPGRPLTVHLRGDSDRI